MEKVAGSICIPLYMLFILLSLFLSCPVLNLAPFSNSLLFDIIVKWSSMSSDLNCTASWLVRLGTISIISFDPFEEGPFAVSIPFGLAVFVDVKLVEFPSFNSSF